MPVLLKDYRPNAFSGRRTVYSKIKRITNRGFETSNDFYAGGNFGILQGLNDNSKDYFSLGCNDIIKFGEIYVACGANAYKDPRTRLSTFLYSEDDGVSWTFSNDTFESYEGEQGNGAVLIVSDDNNTLFCGGSGTDDGTNYYGLMKSTDGKTWTKANSPPIFKQINHMATNGSQEIVAVGFDTTTNANQILRYSADNGVTWGSPLIPGITTADSVTTFYANDRFYIGIYETGTLTVYTYSNLTNWTTVTFTDSDNNSITPFPAVLNGVYYRSVNNSDVYILYLKALGNIIPLVFYSNNGSTFTASTGITSNYATVTNVTYNNDDSNFYLSVNYNYIPVQPSTPIMYTSSDGQSWNGIITSNKLYSVLPSTFTYTSAVTGISQFFIKDSTTIIACGSFAYIYTFGLVSISLPDHDVTSYGTAIALNGVTKLFHDGDAPLVGVSEDTISENTIYYYDETQGKLVATEHQEDVG